MSDTLKDKAMKVVELGLDMAIRGEIEINAAMMNMALNILSGKGGVATDATDPVEAAMNAIRAGRDAGGQLPPMSEQDDAATT